MGASAKAKESKHYLSTIRLWGVKFTFFVSCLFLPAFAFAFDVTLAWDANSASDQVTSYSIYYRTASSGPPYDGEEASEGESPIVVPVSELSDPQFPQYTIHGLIDGEVYYFAVTATNEYAESGFSNEVSTTSTENRPPVLSPIGSRTVDEAQTLTFALSATDPDGDSLTYSASNLPTGANFNPTSRTFTWTPGYGAAGNYSVQFTVTDSATPPASDSETVTITVGARKMVAPTNMRVITTN